MFANESVILFSIGEAPKEAEVDPRPDSERGADFGKSCQAEVIGTRFVGGLSTDEAPVVGDETHVLKATLFFQEVIKVVGICHRYGNVLAMVDYHDVLIATRCPSLTKIVLL